MNSRQKLDMALAYAHMTKAELARRIGCTPQLLSYKLKNDKLYTEDWEKIGKAIGADIDIIIAFADGTKI